MASSSTIPPTMRAWTYSKTGPHRQILELKTDFPAPKQPVGDQIVVKTAYAGPNWGDIKLMKILPTFVQQRIIGDTVPSMNFSGTIVARGDTARSELTVGLKVFGSIQRDAKFWGNGTMREYVAMRTHDLAIAPVPDNLSMEDAAGYGTSGTLAFLIAKKAGIKEGNGYRVLVNGASSSSGSRFAQAVLAMGAKEVIGTCSAPNAEWVKSLGVKEAIDYRTNAPLHEYFAKEYANRPFDIIMDITGNQELYTNSPKYLKQDGVFVNIGDFHSGALGLFKNAFVNFLWPTWLGGTPRKYVFFSGNPTPESMEALVKYVREGKIPPTTYKTYEFEDLMEAFDYQASQRVRGNLVVRIGGD